MREKCISEMVKAHGPGLECETCAPWWLFPAPVGHEVAPAFCELLLLGAVGEHGPDLAFAVDGALEDDVAAVGRPGGEIVGAGVMGKLLPALGGDVHYVDVLTAGRAGTVLAVRTST